jgi:hypothetical protein
MVIERSQFHEGENPRSDQIRRDISSQNSQIDDLLQHFDQFYERQRQKGNGIITLERESKEIEYKIFMQVEEVLNKLENGGKHISMILQRKVVE